MSSVRDEQPLDLDLVSDVPAPTRSAVRRGGWLGLVLETTRLGRTRVGLALVGVVVAIAILGPVLSTASPTEFVGRPYGSPMPGAPLGTDYLGRDVLARYLDGGRGLLLVSLLSTVLAVAVGTALGLIAGSGRHIVDELVMRSLDVVLSFPAIVLPLLFISMLGTQMWLVVLTIAAVQAPRVARVVRGTTLQLVESDFIHYAAAIGTPRRRILFGELLPNVTAPLTVEFGLRMTYAIGIVAALAYLGFGPPPPAPNWGTMINENQQGLSLNAWPVVLPVATIAALTIGVNLVTDGFARVAGGIDRGVDTEEER